MNPALTPDTSVVVAAFARWHERHAVAASVVAAAQALIAHVAVETFSVLTRLPPPRRVATGPVIAFLDHHFPDAPLTLAPEEYPRILRMAGERSVRGGAVYDALVAATAAAHGATVVTLDARAARTYEVIETRYRLIE